MKRLLTPWTVTASLAAIFLLSAGYAAFVARRPPPVPVVSSGEYLARVDARKQGWQPVGIAVARGATIRLTVVDGVWTHARDAPYNGGTGGDYTCGAVLAASLCVEPLPDFPQGGLIGRVGATVFPVGGGASIAAPASGPLHLRINDADEGLYDNDGSLTVRIAVGGP